MTFPPDSLICSSGSEEVSWGNWGSWSQCTKTCGEGTSERRRECPQITSAVFISESVWNPCEGDATETRTCNKDQCKFVLYSSILKCLP